jgi:hypothetical protein
MLRIVFPAGPPQVRRVAGRRNAAGSSLLGSDGRGVAAGEKSPIRRGRLLLSVNAV